MVPGRQDSRLLTPDSARLAFSPDGTEPKYNAYIQGRLAVVTIANGSVRRLGESLGRPIAMPLWNADGTAIDVIVSDAGKSYLAPKVYSGPAPQQNS